MVCRGSRLGAALAAHVLATVVAQPYEAYLPCGDKSGKRHTDANMYRYALELPQGYYHCFT